MKKYYLEYIVFLLLVQEKMQKEKKKAIPVIRVVINSMSIQYKTIKMQTPVIIVTFNNPRTTNSLSS